MSCCVSIVSVCGPRCKENAEEHMFKVALAAVALAQEEQLREEAQGNF